MLTPQLILFKVAKNNLDSKNEFLAHHQIRYILTSR